MKAQTADEAMDAVDQLHRRPGFLIRRANQIMVASFLEAMGDLKITTTQYGALLIISASGRIDQVGLARHLRLDRSTTGLAVMNLEREGLITRAGDPEDKRRRILKLTTLGRDVLAKAHDRGEAARANSMSVFSAKEYEQFMALLSKFVFSWDLPAPESEE